ncbi:MAG: IS256 family transposase [Candidatus Omnitrophica bacterium]|nr:IS256 family transposase [Candidatus Omnitrophota bacterium]
MRSVNFSSDNLAVQFKYLNRNLRQIGMTGAMDSFSQKAHHAVQHMIQSSVCDEFERQVGAKWHERAVFKRRGHRKGVYPRFLTTSFGRSELRVPRLKDASKKAGIKYSIFQRYQRRHKDFDRMVVLSMILGLSTRKQRRFFKAFLGDSVSPSTASRLLLTLSRDLSEFRTRSLEDKYKYLLTDGFWVKVKINGEVKKKVILFVMGIDIQNHKEILSFRLAQGETETEVTSLLNDLYRRGLKGKHLRLVGSDGSKGIKAAIQMVYPYAQWQLCHVHVLRNLAAHTRHKYKHRQTMMEDASKIYKSQTKKEALMRFQVFCFKWQPLEPSAVRLFKASFPDTLKFYDFSEDRDLISSTNSLERDQEEVRRRLKTQGYYQSVNALNLWVFGVIQELHKQRQEQPPKKVKPSKILFTDTLESVQRS